MPEVSLCETKGLRLKSALNSSKAHGLECLCVSGSIFFWGKEILQFFGLQNVILTHAKGFCDKNGPWSSPYVEKLKLKSPDFYNKFPTADYLSSKTYHLATQNTRRRGDVTAPKSLFLGKSPPDSPYFQAEISQLAIFRHCSLACPHNIKAFPRILNSFYDV